MSLPANQRSVIMGAPGSAQLDENAPIPKLRPDYVLVKTVAVALNPTDWKHIDYASTAGGRVGCDYSGIVEDVGENLTRPFKKGDRIAGLVHGCNSVQREDGAFAEYIVAKSALAWHVPDNISLEEASTFGVGISTVGQGLYQTLGLPLPGAKNPSKDTILIYGGSSATGTIAIQYAKLSGWKVVTTCSPRNFDLVKSLGADAAFDYDDPEAPKKIREYTEDKLSYAFDCISSDSTAEFCAKAIGSAGGKYSQLLSAKVTSRKDVTSYGTLAYTTTGEYSVKFGKELPASPTDFKFATDFWALSEQLLKEGKIKAHPVDVRPGGLKGLLDGLDLLRKNKVSGKKVVYRVAETPK